MPSLMERKIVSYNAGRTKKRLGPVSLDEKTRTTLKAFRPILESHLGKIVSDFRDYVISWPECRALLENESGMTCLQRTQGRHWLSLFAGDLDDSYFAQASRIGQAHERVGLEPRWYMGAYCHVMNKIVQLAVDTYREEPAHLAETVRAINRVVELDMEFAISVYNDSAKARTAARLNAAACGEARNKIVGVEPLREVETEESA